MNFGTPVPLLLGIFMVICAVALFFLDRLKPGYERDSDKVYSILFLLSGVFLLANLNLDVISSFQQMLMVGMLVALMIQNINSRTPIAARGGPIDDSGYGGYRPPPVRGGRPPTYGSDNRANLRAELDRRDYGPDDRYNRPRPMLGGREEPGRSPYGQDNYNAYGDDRPVRRSDGPLDRPMDRRPPDARPIDGRPIDERPPIANSDGPPFYGSGPRPTDDRVRRRRPPKSRSEYNDRYRLDPGPPPRPDYRPDREPL